MSVKPLIGFLRRNLGEKISRRTAIWGALLAVFAVVLGFVPLFDVLGYDFSFALGLLAALAAVDIGHSTVARWRQAAAGDKAAAAGEPSEIGPDPRTCLRLFAEAWAASAGVLVLPLLLSLANALRVRNCNLGVGLAFFVLLPVATVVYAAPAGVIAGLAVRRRGRLLAFAIPVLSILWTLGRLYFNPPVFAFDPFGGYFQGPIYDEALRPPAALLYFRLANLIWIAAAIVLVLAVAGRGFDVRRWRRGLLAGAVPLIAASGLIYAMGGQLGFHVTRADLERVLDQTLATEHFVLRYSSGAGKTRADLMLASEDLEFRYHQLRETLGVEPKLPITVWEFPSADVKKVLVGAGGTLYAKPWTREIFLQAERFPSRRLRHEMAHVFAGTFGDRLFGIALTWRLRGFLPMPMLASGLVEGIAEAADASDPDGDATIHQEAAAMIANGQAPPLEAVVGAGFTALPGRRAYTIAGSFTTFLLATRGADKLRALYRSAGNFIDVYRVPLADLEREWRQFLAKQPLTARERAHASEEFRRPAIFKRVCARELAARVVEARAIVSSEPERAVALLESTCRDDPDEPSYRLALADALAAAGRRDKALTLLGRLQVDRDVTVPLRAQAADMAANINFAARDWKNAEAEARRGAEWASSEGDRRHALAKLRALESPAARATLGRALFGDGPGEPAMDPVLTFFLLFEYARVVPSDLLGPYLIGRQLLTRDPARALPYLARACGEDVPATAATAGAPGATQALSPEFLRECRRMTADAAYRVGDFSRARTALERLGAAASGEADRLRALDMRSRVTWAEMRRSRSEP